MFVEQRHDARRHFVHQGHLDKNQRHAGQTGMKKSVAAPVAVEPVFDIGPALDVMHGFVLDQLFNQGRWRIPADAAQVQKADVKPGRKHVFQLDIQRHQAFVGFQEGQHFGPHVHQKPNAVRVHAEALQQAAARRDGGAAVMHFGHGLIGRSDRSGKPDLRLFGFLHISNKNFAHQQPHVAAMIQRRDGIPGGHVHRPPPAFNFTHARINDGLQRLQAAAQQAGRQGFALLAQRGFKPHLNGTRGQGLFARSFCS